MPPQAPYPNAPITEAIIDIRVQLPEGTGVGELEKVQEGLEAAYPTKRKRMQAEFHGEMGERGATAAASSKQIGYVFKSRDEKQVFQARLDGFTMSRLAPYESWDPFRDEARRLWKVYRSVVQPVRVTRLAVRYINRLDLPFPVTNLKEYLRTVPEVSSDLPQELAGYFMQLRIPQKDIGSVLLVNQTIIEPAKPGVASVVLDIDVFRADDPPSRESDIWEFLEKLRICKNEVFEACVTDKARELFQ